ncbi:MAG: hypothetical protein PHW72_01840 [Candidatus Pacebacteria bacterium]|nr:hypothetical protein [Candidatus Paceibacterota bacterium]
MKVKTPAIKIMTITNGISSFVFKGGGGQAGGGWGETRYTGDGSGGGFEGGCGVSGNLCLSGS